ncbi:MAG TPA: type II secretion system F family protein [Pseudolysinimonas sp.]|nr:type II secretion system F family protein [Pseudolysinimonas sp.]
MSIAVKNFAYTSRNDAGKVVKGKVEAQSEAAAVAKIRGLGLQPVTVEESLAGTGLQREIHIPGFEKSVGLKDLAIMSRQLATMISSGLSLLRALSILASQTDNKKLAGILQQVSVDVENGGSLSDAFAKHPVDFPPLMINMIRAGETGGFLEKAMESLAVNYEKENKLRSAIKSAMAYPVMVLVMSFVAVILMLLFIVPVFKEMFDGLGSELPGPTLALVVVSENMWWITPILVVALIAGSIWWRLNKNTDAVRRVIDPLKLRAPVFGQLARKIAIARFTRNFANMISGGVPILTALNVVGETSGNWVIAQATQRIAESVRQGQSITKPLATEPVFPPMVVQMMAVGEDSGSLDTMLVKIADFYDDEVERMTEALTSLIEPLLIAFLGVVVGGMIVALYLPIFNIATVVK